MSNKISPPLTTAVKDRKWSIVLNLLQQGRRKHTEEEYRQAVDAFVSEAPFQCDGEDNVGQNWCYHNIISHCNSDQLDAALTRALKEGWLSVVKNKEWALVQKMTCDSVVNTLRFWTVSMQEKLPHNRKGLRSPLFPRKTGYHGHCDADDFWLTMKHCRVPASLAHELATALTKDINSYTEILAARFPFTAYQDNDTGVVFKTILFILCCVMCGGLTQDLNCIDDRIVTTIHEIFFAGTPWIISKTMPEIELLSQENLLIRLSIRPYPLELPSAVKNMVLQHLLRHQKWDVISHVTCLSGVWEHVRRDLIQKTVEQQRWCIVKQWADHTVFDNQRWWVIQEAYKHKQWQVMLLMADHGLTETELMWVRCRLAMYADWDVVLQMFERGVDVTEVREVVESNIRTARKTARDPEKRRALEQRRRRLLVAEEKLAGILYRTTGGRGRCLDDSRPVHTVVGRQAKLRVLKAAKSGKWCLAFFHFHRNLKNNCLQEALQIAVESEAWHVVIQLVRLLGMDTAQRDSFFMQMFERRQWAVCRALLDQGVSVQLCLDVLPQLIEMDQWMLVARVMEFNVGDVVRRQVLQHSMAKSEGSVAWRCIITMQDYSLSLEERKELFQQAFSRGVWQAIKPLVEKEDSTGIQHRDTALLAAIEQHQWDVVDYCQHYHADINMKDEQGETPLNTAARKKDWRAVDELVVRGADPNLLDRRGCSVMYRAIDWKKWETVKLLIICLADIHQPSEFPDADPWNGFYESTVPWNDYCELLSLDVNPNQPRTPLESLITARQGEIIHHSLMWCPDQAKGVNDWGETTLHAIALGKRPDLMYYQVVRGVNPLTVTKFPRQSVLLYAVQNPHCPQKMVSECIRLGFSTHQPQLTGTIARITIDAILKDFISHSSRRFFEGIPQELSQFCTSPFLLSVLNGLPVIAHMLYESGSCSNTELYYLYHHLQLVESDRDTERRRKLLQEGIVGMVPNEHNRQLLVENIERFLPYLKEMATTPRSLVSSCRLVISHCLNVRRRYHRDVQQLYLSRKKDPRLPMTGNNVQRISLPDRMKNYILFSDLTNDPEPSWYSYRTMSDKS